MLLYLDDQLISEDTTAQELDTVLDGLDAKHHYTVMLHDGGDVTLEASGNPELGYILAFTNHANHGRVISNEGMRPITVKKVLHSFLAGESDWQHAIGWYDPKTSGRQAPQANVKAMRVAIPLLILLMIFAFGFVPLFSLAHAVVDAVYFVPQCATLNPNVAVLRYEGGGTGPGGIIADVTTRLTEANVGVCVFADGTTQPFSGVTGSAGSAITADRMGNIAAITLVFGGFFVAMFVIVLLFMPRRKG